MKKQEKTPEKELNEMEASKLPDTEYQPMVIRMLKELRENFNSIKKDMKTILKKTWKPQKKEPVRNEVYTNRHEE